MKLRPLSKQASMQPTGRFNCVGWWVVAVLACGTLLALLAPFHWVADLIANLRVQQCIALIVAVIVFAVMKRRLHLACVMLMLATHLPWFIPDHGGTQDPLDGLEQSTNLRITVANALVHNRNHDAVIADLVARDPDVFVVLELTHTLAMRIGQQTKDRYPFVVQRPQEHGSFGIGLYSKMPLEEVEVFSFDDEIDSLAVNIPVDSEVCRIYATHPPPPMNRTLFQWRNDQLHDLALRIKAYRDRAPATRSVLVGDFNLTPWSPWFRLLESESGLTRASIGFDMTPTWYKGPAVLPFGLVLDHALISSGWRCIDHRIGPYIGSDHRSVTVDLAAASREE